MNWSLPRHSCALTARRRRFARWAVMVWLFLLPSLARGQSATGDTQPGVQTESQPSSAPDQTESAAATTMFPHSDTSRLYLAGQINIIFQWHPAFPAKYTGPNSLTPAAQSATTHIFTLYTGFAVTHTTEILVDFEEASGGGIGSAVGLAGFTDLDSVRTVQGVALSKSPYLARLMLRQIIPLSKDRTVAARSPLGLATSLPARRIEIRAGKFTLPDFVDTNTGGSDAHLQFMNWTVDNNGAWDYAANTRGYTDGALIEYDDHWFSVRFVEALMPKVANGIYLDADLARAHSDNLEATVHGNLWGRAGAVRFLAYENHANMGNYHEAIENFLHGLTPTPDIVSTREQGRTKYGFGGNAEQQLTSDLGVFARWGWSDGHNESFAYTEVDSTVEGGAWLQGNRWRRPRDKIGIALVTNGISADHREYLRLGGLGFLLGDGNLNYGREDIVETFYNVHFWRGLFGAIDLQHIQNPGYNMDRGPVWVPGLRLHVDF